MNESKKNNFKIIYFILVYLTLWVILFEFIIPVNNILPKPSIVILSFGSLWQDYHLLNNLLFTITNIYLALFAAYFVLIISRHTLSKKNNIITDFFLSLNWFSKYIPAIIFGIFLIYWFPNSNIVEFIFAFIIAFFSLTVEYRKDALKFPKEFKEAAFSLGAGDLIISKKIIWKGVQPKLFKHLYKLQFEIWSILIVFEFIKGSFGLGEIYRTALNFHDLSALFSITIVVGVLIYLGSLLIKYLENKICHWSLS